MDSNSKMVKVDCGKCGGNGRYYFGAHSHGACYPCNGTGKVSMSAAKFEAMKAAAADHAARYEAHRAAELAELAAFEGAYFAARELIERDGIRGARAYFTAHRTDAQALSGLIAAMRDFRFEAESNKVVAYRNAMLAVADEDAVAANRAVRS